ncbi:hypothetical protein VTL71DRAFT_11302 [Oculimacula yallundae]|uniref:Major facilitator superfamily (MFS) profile domain-containing protein n=1 Tax=Oculimacula yallundae TaxID=86028 RepID=A0ABR4CSA6_9HELO
MKFNVNQSVGPELVAVLPKDLKPWYKTRHLLKLNFCIFSLVLFASANGYDGSLMNGLQALPRWDKFMKSPKGAWLGWINAIYWLGTGIVSLIAGRISNSYGRKTSLYVGYACLLLGTILQTAAPNPIAFMMARLFLGGATGFFGNVAPLIINEISYPTHRSICSALFMCGFYVGGLVAAWVTFGTQYIQSSWTWRLPSALQLLIPALALPGFILVPESPRYLISNNRINEAHKILADWHAGGDLDAPLIRFEMAEIENTIRFDQESSSSGGYADMIKTRGNRHRLFISITLGIFGQWVGNGVVSYYLAAVLQTVGITNVVHQLIISACLQIWNLFFSVVAAFSVDSVGRRKLFLASSAIMTVSFIIITGLSGSFASSGSAATGTAVIPFLFIFFAGYDIALTPLLTAYPCEIWPYALRSRGLAITWVSTISAIFFNTFINPIALVAIAWKYYFVFVVFCIGFGITAFFFYPETRGHTLEQMAVIFDGEDAHVANMAQSSEKAGVEETIAVEHEYKEKV